jgi:ribosome biogenesis GTPase A
MIKRKSKKLIFVINKIDLVDRKKLHEELNEKNIYPYVLVSCKNRFGSRLLRDRIKIEAKRIVSRFNIRHVGVIGYPNTGKSSLINFLIGRTASRTASEPGFTKSLKKIRLTSEIVLFDTPGVIPDSDYSSSVRDKLAQHAMVNARDYNKVRDPDFIIYKIMQEYPNRIESFYGVESDGDPEILLEKVGRKKFFIKKGNLVDIDRTARFILKDWQEGKITCY